MWRPQRRVRADDTYERDEEATVPDHYIVVEREDPIAVVTIDRADKLNALNWELIAELADKLDGLDRDEAIRCIVLTGAGNRAFAAGADIAEMAGQSVIAMATGGFESWDRIRRLTTPMIAAVGGLALGGGDELAMHADNVLGSGNAHFCQPQVPIRVDPRPLGNHALPTNPRDITPTVVSA